MPTTINVKVNTVQPTTRGNYNMIEITGYDHTNNRGFKKAFFEEKKAGGRTAIALISDTLKQDDWVEIVIDDTTYKNIQTMKQIGEPAGADVPTQAGGGGGGGNPAGNSGGGGTTKRGNYRTVGALNREVALSSAVKMFSGEKATKGTISSLEKLAIRMEAFLVKGDFDAEVDEVVVPPPPVADPPPVAQPDNTPPIDNNPAPQVEDDDIPF